MKRPPFRLRQGVVISAALDAVWEFNQDLTKIAEYHPRVNKVDFVSGATRRGADVAYRCHLKDGKNTCVERDIEVVPMKRIVTALPEDTMGLHSIFPDYIVETVFTAIDEQTTRMEFRHYYSTSSIKAKLANLIAGRRIARESQDTLNAIKQAIEREGDSS